jgi:tetratricopeptide (TPR) repeat protein
MDTDPQRTKPLALEPIASAPAEDAPTRQLRITIADEFVAEAAQEYQQGRIDQALWSHASLAGGDEALIVAAYLRARATALRMARRSKHPEHREPAAATAQAASRPSSDAKSTNVAAASRLAKRRTALAAAIVALSLIVALVLMFAAQRQAEAPTAPAVPKPPPTKAAQTTETATPAQLAAAGANSQSARNDDVLTLETKVKQLKDAANWNVLVLYASEWTRKEPSNAAAWSDLGLGYVNLRQYDDALNAASRAVQLAPTDALLWRNLAQVNLALDRLADAAAAFDNAVLANPGDVVALCGAAAVAQKQGRAKDADTLVARVKSMDARCPNVGIVDNAVAVPATARKLHASAGR